MCMHHGANLGCTLYDLIVQCELSEPNKWNDLRIACSLEFTELTSITTRI